MPNKETHGLRLQFKFHWISALCVLFLLTCLIWLGFWQLNRAEQKQQFQSDLDALRLAKPIAVESLRLDDENELKSVRVILDGSYVNNKSVFVSNQFFQNRPGYEVFTAFKLHSSDQIVLVSRGWISINYDSQQLPAIEPVTGAQQLVGEIYMSSAKSFFLPQKIESPVSWPLLLHHFDINNIKPLFDTPLLPFIVRLEQTSSGVLKRHWRKTRLNLNNSTSYAIQWFGMALILIVITIIKSTNILEIISSHQSTR
jgi:cytochrome oxidase assembly protein ShyY1